jgi:hypothetical protein
MCELRDFLGIYICIPWRAEFYFRRHPKRGINGLVAEIPPPLHFFSGKNTATVFFGSTAGFDVPSVPLALQFISCGHAG